MLNIQQIIEDYNNGIGTEKLALKYHVGKIKIKNILLENGVELKKRGGQKQVITYKLSDIENIMNMKDKQQEILDKVEDYLRETYISAIGEKDYSIDDMIEHFRNYFNIK